jgi:general secretion pathway protein G
MNFFNFRNKGFTLVELLVVIAIISILSTVIFAVLNESREKARDAKRISDLKNIELALEVYFADNGHYPTRTVNSSQGAAWNGDTDSLKTDLSPYINVPVDPLRNNGTFPYSSADGQFNYHYNSDGYSYDLVGRLEQENTYDCAHNQSTYLINIGSGDYDPGEEWCGDHAGLEQLFTP